MQLDSTNKIVAPKRGRPRVGDPKQVRLSDEEQNLANELGDGVLALGLRRALHATKLMQERSGIASRITDDYLSDLKSENLLNSFRIIVEMVTLNAPEIKLTGDVRIDEFSLRNSISIGFENLIQSSQLLKNEQDKRNLNRFEIQIDELNSKTAMELGSGSVLKGVEIALESVRFFGIDTVKKVAHGSSNNKSK